MDYSPAGCREGKKGRLDRREKVKNSRGGGKITFKGALFRGGGCISSVTLRGGEIKGGGGR